MKIVKDKMAMAVNDAYSSAVIWKKWSGSTIVPTAS